MNGIFITDSMNDSHDSHVAAKHTVRNVKKKKNNAHNTQHQQRQHRTEIQIYRHQMNLNVFESVLSMDAL